MGTITKLILFNADSPYLKIKVQNINIITNMDKFIISLSKFKRLPIPANIAEVKITDKKILKTKNIFDFFSFFSILSPFNSRK